MRNFIFAKYTFEIYLKKTTIGILKSDRATVKVAKKEKYTKERSYKVSRREEIEESRAKPFTSNATFLLLHRSAD